MVYNHLNVEPRTSVFDVDAANKMELVKQIDTLTGEVECYHQPIRVTFMDEVDTFKIRFRSIHAISGGGHRPCLFHCYGRKA